jgi:iron-sulfur cluster repair protein YtfE (RIC family)
MNESILTTLRQEHREVEDILGQIKSCSDVVLKKDLYLQLKEELVPHMEGEEKTLYAHMVEDTLNKDSAILAYEAHHEHQEIKEMLATIDNTSIENKKWSDLLVQLEKKINQHIKKEEKNLFGEVKEDFSKEELIEFSEEFIQARKESLDRSL